MGKKAQHSSERIEIKKEDAMSLRETMIID